MAEKRSAWPPNGILVVPISRAKRSFPLIAKLDPDAMIGVPEIQFSIHFNFC
jgi:hypothetical protein